MSKKIYCVSRRMGDGKVAVETFESSAFIQIGEALKCDPNLCEMDLSDTHFLIYE